MYAWLPGSADVLDPEGPAIDALPFAPRTAFALDVSDQPRLGEAGNALFAACRERAVLDHHSTNTGFGDLFVLDGDAAAAGEMAVALIDALGVTMTREMAECLFVAISTDCGQFNYSNTRPQTFRAAARCSTLSAVLPQSPGITEGTPPPETPYRESEPPWTFACCCYP